jgi:hypothetical protein
MWESAEIIVFDIVISVLVRGAQALAARIVIVRRA